MPNDNRTNEQLAALLSGADAEADRIKGWLNDAYEAGRQDARAELTVTLQAMQEQIGRLIGSTIPAKASAVAVAVAESMHDENGKPKAKRGSVRPAILSLLREMAPGPSVREVFIHHNEIGSFAIAEPSIRSVLGDLRKEGLVEKRGERWFLIKKEKGSGESEPPSNSEPDDSMSVSADSDETHRPASHSGFSASGLGETGNFHRVRSDLLSGTAASDAPFNPQLPSMRG